MPEDLELLLVHADDQQAVVQDGLPASSTGEAPSRQYGDRLTYLEGDLNSLEAQRWGIVAPQGALGDRLLEIVAPLREARREQQGGEKVRVYRVPAGMSVDDTLEWRRTVYDDEEIDERERPLNLLVLGDADAVSFEFQQAMASRSLVGRLGFAGERGYEAYLHKLLASERDDPAAAQARALFHTVLDGTSATSIGDRSLMRPTVERARKHAAAGSFPVQAVVDIEGEGDALLAAAAERDPALLFTISHGLGPPRAGWKSAAQREEMQGAMSLGMGQKLCAADVAERPFLPKGIWFFLACYGAGTPSASGYEDWLRMLKAAGRYGGSVEAVLAGLPKEGERPFVAALPQAALANPEGPLAVIGHVDLAWTYGFQETGPKAQNRSSRFQGVFRALIDGSRVGVAHRALMRSYSDAAEQIAMIQGGDDRARARGKAVTLDPAELARRAALWMQTTDLSHYVLLGDPAARLPLGERAIEKARPSPPKAAAAALSGLLGFPSTAKRPAHSPEIMRDAVRELLGKGDPQAIAQRLGIKPAELETWAKTYDKGGLLELRKRR